MNKLSHAHYEIKEIEALSEGNSVIHRLHPLCKLLMTIFYIIVVVSFPKYDISNLVVMVLYPVILFQAANISVKFCFYRLRFILPFICAVGLANPFLDHTPFLQLNGIVVTGGMVSMSTLMLKGIFSLMASFLLIATTSIDSICAALRKLHIPTLLTTLLLLTYRYLSVMVEEVSIMVQAYQLRAPGQKGIHFSAWGSFLGQLLLRSLDKSEELYNSMILRGFNGNFYYTGLPMWTFRSTLFLAACIIYFLCARFFNISRLIGSLFMR